MTIFNSVKGALCNGINEKFYHVYNKINLYFEVNAVNSFLDCRQTEYKCRIWRL